MSEAAWGAPAPQQGGWGEQAAPAQETWGGAAAPAQQATQQAPSQEDYLKNDSVKAFSFDGPPGTEVDGLVVSAKVVQQIDFDTRQPATWGNGDPKWTLRVHLQTAAHDTPEDDGIRAVFYDYKKKDSLDEAFKVANVKPVVEVGARIKTAFAAGGPKDRSANATKFKTYRTVYAPPGHPAAEALKGQLASGTAPAPAAPVVQPVAQDEAPF